MSGKNGVGSWRYSIDPTTKVLSLAYAFGSREPKLWIEGQQPPQDLMSAIEAGARIHGWNSMSFERAIFHNQCVPKLGWIEPKPEQYHDTMLDALTLGLPAALEDTISALKLPDQKLEEGKKLIQRLCKPISAGKKKGQFREREEFREDYARLYVYNKQDVRAERGVYLSLPYHLTGKERELAMMFMRMNERGLPIDEGLVDAVIEGLELESVMLGERFFKLTGIDRPTMRAQFQEWLIGKGLELPDMQAATLAKVDFRKYPSVVREALTVYNEGNNTSTAKFAKIKTMINPDGTVKNNLIFNKASTGRAAGAGFQAQNLPSESDKGFQVLIDAFFERDYDFLRLYCGVQKAAKIMIRPTIYAPPGLKFVSGDLQGIEARDTAWVAGEFNILDNYRKGIDAYVSSASQMYHIALAEVTKAQRQAGKVAVLSGGFGGGYRALMEMAAKFGMNLTPKEAKKIVKDFRAGRKLLVEMWANFEEAAWTAIEGAGMVWVDGTRKTIGFYREGRYLFMKLPSGRLLSFPFAEIREMPYFGKMKKSVTAMWVDSSPGGNHKWKRRILTGANLFQSAVQASSRDIMFDGHLAVEEAGYPLVLSVHDEGLSLVPDTPDFSTREYGELITRNKGTWYETLPLEADCWEGFRYRK